MVLLSMQKINPTIIRCCAAKQPIPVYMVMAVIFRDWLYVEDHCEAIHLILTQGRLGETYNVGGNKDVEYCVSQADLPRDGRVLLSQCSLRALDFFCAR